MPTTLTPFLQSVCDALSQRLGRPFVVETFMSPDPTVYDHIVFAIPDTGASVSVTRHDITSLGDAQSVAVRVSDLFASKLAL